MSTTQRGQDTYCPGDYYLICDVCGFQFRRSEMRERWDKAMVCRKDWEPQHPQEFLRGRADRIGVPVARPEATDYFLSDNEVTTEDL